MAQVKSRGIAVRPAQSWFRIKPVYSPIFRALILASMISLAGSLSAQTQDRPKTDPFKASTGRLAKEEAIHGIPLDKLSAGDKAKIAKLLAEPHIFRRLPVHLGPCDPDLYLFLVRHPDVVVGIWEELDLSKFRMKQVGDNKFQTNDSDGSTGTAHFMYQDSETHLLWVEGRCDNRLFAKPVKGTSLLILRTGYIRESDGRYYITSRLDTFTHIEDVGIEFVTRTLQPLMGKVVDNNFLQTAAFVGSFSRTAEKNPQGVRRLAGKLEKVDPEVRNELSRLAFEVADRSTRRNAALAAVKPKQPRTVARTAIRPISTTSRITR